MSDAVPSPAGRPTHAAPRIVDGRAMLLAGIRRVHGFAESPRTIPAQWSEFMAGGDVPGQVGRVAYGAICGADMAGQTFEYMCAVEVASFDDLPASYGRMRVPAQRYAVFTHDGPVSTIRATWQHAWTAWLPASGYRMANTPEFERYGEAFDAGTGRGDIEVWVSVDPAPTRARDG